MVEFCEFAVKKSGLAGDSLVLATRLSITLYNISFYSYFLNYLAGFFINIIINLS